MEVANNVRCLLAARKLAKSLMGVRTFSSSCRVAAGYGGHGGEYQPLPIKTEIGKREVVGFGINGEESYVDTIMAPFPAIRFKEDSAEILKLRQKEKGDWKKLTVAEKKDLYRASFCQTFAEVHAPTGTWKYMVGTSFFLMSMGIWLFYFTVTFVYGDMPSTVTDEAHLKATLKRMVDMRVGGIEGFTSNYDYEKEEWKK